VGDLMTFLMGFWSVIELTMFEVISIWFIDSNEFIEEDGNTMLNPSELVEE
jgi:hypothetical protein